jgi:hypothetical protein
MPQRREKKKKGFGFGPKGIQAFGFRAFSVLDFWVSTRFAFGPTMIQAFGCWAFLFSSSLEKKSPTISPLLDQSLQIFANQVLVIYLVLVFYFK